MSSIIRKNKLFFALCITFLSFCTLQSLLNAKGSLVLAFNSLYSPATNIFFKTITFLGDGLAFVIIALIILLFIKIRWGIIGLLTYAISGLFAQFFKKIVFGPLPRPHKYFEGIEELQSIEGLHNATIHSFPSGHTTTAFAMFTFIALLYGGNKTIAVICFVLAVITAVSRIYLAQHFIEDVIAGTVLGTVCSTLLYFWWEEKQPGFFKAPVLDRPLLKLS